MKIKQENVDEQEEKWISKTIWISPCILDHTFSRPWGSTMITATIRRPSKSSYLVHLSLLYVQFPSFGKPSQYRSLIPIFVSVAEEQASLHVSTARIGSDGSWGGNSSGGEFESFFLFFSKIIFSNELRCALVIRSN